MSYVHNAMQITFRAETEIYDESHRVLEREICEFFVVLESANQPVDQTTSNESWLHWTPAQKVSWHIRAVARLSALGGGGKEGVKKKILIWDKFAKILKNFQ